jgi:hypothetical protein
MCVCVAIPHSRYGAVSASNKQLILSIPLGMDESNTQETNFHRSRVCHDSAGKHLPRPKALSGSSELVYWGASSGTRALPHDDLSYAKNEDWLVRWRLEADQ